MATTWNPSDLLNTTLSGGNLTATGTSTTGGVRTVLSQSTGKWYWETTLSGFSGINAGLGFGNASASLSSAAFSAANAVMVLFNGNVYVAGTGAGAITSNPSLICHALDLNAGLYWARNGAAGSWNATGGTANNPATGVGGFNISAVGGAAKPAFPMVLFSASGMATTANFGATAFTGTVPTGFSAGFAPSGAAQAMVMVLA